ncbi:aminoglycoside N(3')-acetyltransferase VIII [Striga asiatica]|uniref:Aminoglycoside N(3')-acetyltransferase VIII n=1 Tax=Striga asiatica TaxID=4170 RepID=A0A5A7QZM0_STRAF|nr:aminoglycoside N(3')-acetyltransferase VIII [Striga asiatica]
MLSWSSRDKWIALDRIQLVEDTWGDKLGSRNRSVGKLGPSHRVFLWATKSGLDDGWNVSGLQMVRLVVLLGINISDVAMKLHTTMSSFAYFISSPPSYRSAGRDASLRFSGWAARQLPCQLYCYLVAAKSNLVILFGILADLRTPTVLVAFPYAPKPTSDITKSEDL